MRHFFDHYRISTALFGFFLKPKSKNRDRARRELILNILLLPCLLLSALSMGVVWWTILFDSKSQIAYTGVDFFCPLFFFVIVCFLFFLSKIGKHVVASGVLLSFAGMVSMYTSYQWGVDIPQSLLTFALIIVMAGILIGSRFAFWITILITIFLVSLTHLQFSRMIPVDSTWREGVADDGDAITYSAVLLTIAVVSWLFNKESEKALRRARISENTLLKERNDLEKKVYERTQELRLAQTEKINQLYSFAELGKSMSVLFHDLAHPLNLVVLNLEELNSHSKKIPQNEFKEIKSALKRAMKGTRRMELFVQETRAALSHTHSKKLFTPAKEIQEAISFFKKKAQECEINIQIQSDLLVPIRLRGSPIRFQQVIGNILSNAIDAHQTQRAIKEGREIILRLANKEKVFFISIEDNAGNIQLRDLEKVFDPFYSTKEDGKHLGIGLSICKDIIEKDFKGSITARISQGKTIFQLSFPLERKI